MFGPLPSVSRLVTVPWNCCMSLPVMHACSWTPNAGFSIVCGEAIGWRCRPMLNLESFE
jgi:hypothetical protein